MMKRRALAGAAAALLPIPRGVLAQTPGASRPIRMVVGFPAGQALDIGARMLSAKLGEVLRQPVFVDNRPGATGIISHEHVKGSPPDGSTLLLGSGATLAINPALYRRLPYDPVRDFTPIALINTSPMFLVTGANVPVTNLAEMIAYVRARPGQVSYGSGGSGLTQHIAMEMLKKAAGIDLLHVPYRGSPAMVTDLIAGRVEFGFDTSTSILPHAESGRVRLIGVSSAERSPQAPAVPTLAEQGLPGFLALTWAGLMGPAGMSAAQVEPLNAAINIVLRAPDVVAHYEASGSTIRGGTPEEFAAFLRAELARWGEAVAASGAQVD